MARVPHDLKYTKSHEWVRIEGDVATIGITDHAQSELGDVVHVELPAVGKRLAAGETFGAVESVKTVSDLYAPVAGEVIEVNVGVTQAPEKVNEDPYGAGMMLRLRIDGEPAGLLTPEEYEAASA